MESINNLNKAIDERTRPGGGRYVIAEGRYRLVDDPDDLTVVLPRARVERLREFAEAAKERDRWERVEYHSNARPWPDYLRQNAEAVARFFRALDAIQPGDLDPLP